MVKLITYLATIGVLHEDRLYLPDVVSKSFPLKWTKQKRNVYKERITQTIGRICLFGLDELV